MIGRRWRTKNLGKNRFQCVRLNLVRLYRGMQFIRVHHPVEIFPVLVCDLSAPVLLSAPTPDTASSAAAQKSNEKGAFLQAGRGFIDRWNFSSIHNGDNANYSQRGNREGNEWRIEWGSSAGSINEA